MPIPNTVVDLIERFSRNIDAYREMVHEDAARVDEGGNRNSGIVEAQVM